MPLFEFDEGRLVPAQFGRPVHEPVEPEVLQSVREQVLEVVQRPLFPVSWHDEDASPRLTAMDATGQVVTVEVVERLDAGALVAALSRAGRAGDRRWVALAESYPRGVDAFRLDWTAFRETMPPRPTPGPRLIVVAGAVDDDVRPALETLTASGVVVHELSVRQMSNGRRFLDVTQLGEPFVGYPQVLPGRAARRPELSVPYAAQEWDEPGLTDDAVLAPRALTDEPALVAPAASNGMPAPALSAIAAALDGPTELVWARGPGRRHTATLLPDGTLTVGGRTFLAPDEAAAAVAGSTGEGPVDGWQAWRFGEGGPSLGEARDELAARPAPAEPAGGLRRRARRRRASTA
ncbi:hypothetical protein [Georgenia faecalis]|uniref:RAMA domain-containing protein n=1 Tax=Georgenia faecalis TaxID=2483799 RepID=A0ABV9DCW0_9MICO|nr:hypothetical protein [Georgenia faecalis]